MIAPARKIDCCYELKTSLLFKRWAALGHLSCDVAQVPKPLLSFCFHIYKWEE